MAVPHCALCHTGLAGLTHVPGAASEPRHRAQSCSGHSPATAAAARLGQGLGQESSSSLPGIPQGVTGTGWETAVAGGGGSGKAASGTGCLCLSMFMGNMKREISGLSQLVKHLG